MIDDIEVFFYLTENPNTTLYVGLPGAIGVLLRSAEKRIALKEVTAQGQGLDEELLLRVGVITQVPCLNVHRLAVSSLTLDQPYVSCLPISKALDEILQHKVCVIAAIDVSLEQ